MRFLLRRSFAAAVALFLAWQAVTAVIDLYREVAGVRPAERRRALVASEKERIDTSLSWIRLYRTIEERVPAESIVAFCFSLDPGTFAAFYQVVPLIYPRRAIPILQSLPIEVVEGSARAARQLSRPTFIVDLRSGFPLPQKRSLVVEERDFALWRVER